MSIYDKHQTGLTNTAARDEDEPFFVQGATIHDGGGLAVEENGRFVRICLGAEQQHQASFTPRDGLRIAAEIEALSRRKLSASDMMNERPRKYG
ncbi:hypothetical protein ACFFUB_02475 [Algimonas porphyrae]|uniref:Uncharacterized protein n=1 Tax=Algimonas porphyrae TaxID=1128113 RepID=A0ABQ5V1C4_9PROT|nr:hypothetical protein [Algimonas porphyrae]GLQ20376.1 hypothetical protein GCM10007854_13310 [Algimonas porphyrae]